MNARVLGNPDFGHLEVRLARGERIRAGWGAMAAMSPRLTVKSRLLGGPLAALGRRVLAGEPLLLAEYAADAESDLTLSPSVPGFVVRKVLSGDSVVLAGGAFLAATARVRLRTRFLGLGALVAGAAPFFLSASGRGHLWFNAHGGLVERDVEGDLIVAGGHVVAWEPTLSWEAAGSGSAFSAVLSGEGHALRFRGRGKVWIQTRSLRALGDWLRTHCREAGTLPGDAER